MRALASRIRPRLSYATVVSSLTAFVVLCGGAAFAANQVGKSSVGKKQLKANAVTTAKIKKNAVTTAKISVGAVDGSKVKDASLGVGNLNVPDMPFQRIVHEVRGSATTAVGTERVVLPLDNASYTQAIGEDDFYLGHLDITFQPGCEAPREASAILVVDSQKPTDPSPGDIVAGGYARDESGIGTVTKRLSLGSFETGGARFQPDVPTGHTLAIAVDSSCKAGSGVTASGVAVDVIGVR